MDYTPCIVNLFLTARLAHRGEQINIFSKCRSLCYDALSLQTKQTYTKVILSHLHPMQFGPVNLLFTSFRGKRKSLESLHGWGSCFFLSPWQLLLQKASRQHWQAEKGYFPLLQLQFSLCHILPPGGWKQTTNSDRTLLNNISVMSFPSHHGAVGL